MRLRPIAPGDAGALQAFVAGLSLHARHMRFHNGLRELSPQWLRMLTDVDPRWQCAFVAEDLPAPGLEPRLVADLRYVRDAERPHEAEFAIVVADRWQGMGLGRRLMAWLRDHATNAGVQVLVGDVLADNRRAIVVMRSAGATVAPHPDGAALVRLRIDLAPSPL